ncbi:nucleotide-diphospho-sugar transferase [Amylocarpus encephaloides]|uniref:Nucleotide-diphospho-sugar transferase n=1 Tax=Amylocarpus encephaloides TaxID=45428 RepID=A0A9P7Y7M7_9HELO|nr:nucleotide-diphospho-sugar transferase [Amylocarpus encephaloides]
MHQVSVVVPSFNAGLYLRDCVSSIRENSAGVEVEVIIVDDGSTDDTSIRVLSDLGSEPDLKIIRHEKNLGVQVARNNGLKAASGDYVLCVDADDVLLPILGHGSFLSEATRILSTDHHIAFVHTLVRMFGDFHGLTISSYPLREELVARKHHVPIAIVYRRNEILNGLLYMETVLKWQDWAFGVSLLARRWERNERSEIGFIEGPGYGYRVHSTSSRISQTQISEFDATKLVVEVYREFFISKFPDIANDIDDLTAAVVASKPGPLEDLLFVASFKLEHALSMARGREYQLHSAHVNRLGIP